jgi:uncharacterized RDD family membrane protein YckC
VELDDRITLAGAEGVDLEVVLAGLGSRVAAALFDLVLQVLAIFALGFVGALFGDAGVVLVAVGGLLVMLGYPILAEAFAGGQTVGKRILGLTVVRLDGSPVTFLGAVIRNVLRVIDILPGTYLVGAVAIFVSPRNQRVGDIAAGTLVVQRPRPGANAPRPMVATASASATGPAAWGGVGPVPGSTMAPVLSPEVAGWDVTAVTAEEVAAVRTFLLRRADLDPGHRANLAQTLAFQLLPKVAGVPLDGGPELFLERVAAARAG